MNWREWTLVVVLVFVPLLCGFVAEIVNRRRARARHKVLLTPAQRQEAFYKTWTPAIEKSKGPQEFYDVEREGL